AGRPPGGSPPCALDRRGRGDRLRGAPRSRRRCRVTRGRPRGRAQRARRTDGGRHASRDGRLALRGRAQDRGDPRGSALRRCRRPGGGSLRSRGDRSMSQSSRSVSQVVTPEPVVEGAGVHLRRSIGTRKLDHLDPFLLLDHFESASPADYQAGFPYHPHRGIETVTIVRKGEIQHRDSLEHSGTIGAGDIQWMTSGSGIMHGEMPQVRPEGLAGLQLCLNLPAREKMTRPKYRDLQAELLIETALDGGASVRVIAGESSDGRLTGPVGGPAVGPKFVDATRPPGTAFRETVPRGHTAFAYVDHGEIRFGPEQTLARG